MGWLLSNKVCIFFHITYLLGTALVTCKIAPWLSTPLLHCQQHVFVVARFELPYAPFHSSFSFVCFKKCDVDNETHGRAHISRNLYNQLWNSLVHNLPVFVFCLSSDVKRREVDKEGDARHGPRASSQLTPDLVYWATHSLLFAPAGALYVIKQPNHFHSALFDLLR